MTEGRTRDQIMERSRVVYGPLVEKRAALRPEPVTKCRNQGGMATERETWLEIGCNAASRGQSLES